MVMAMAAVMTMMVMAAAVTKAEEYCRRRRSVVIIAGPRNRLGHGNRHAAGEGHGGDQSGDGDLHMLSSGFMSLCPMSRMVPVCLPSICNEL